MDVNKIKRETDQNMKKLKRKKRFCMFENCKKVAINSHVFQQNRILNQLCHKNHLYQLSSNSQFDIFDKGLVTLRKFGINQAFSFYGFCKNHDDNLFASIEKGVDIDFTDVKSVLLLSYKNICNEIYRETVAMEQFQFMYDLYLKLLNTETNLTTNRKLHICKNLKNFSIAKQDFLHNIKNLSYFKEELEKDNNNIGEQKFIYDVIKIPKVELCLAAALDIYNSNDLNTINYDKEKQQYVVPHVTSMINIFPYKECTYITTVVHKEFPCTWTLEFQKRVKESDLEEVGKLLTHLLIYRTEYWCISEDLKQKIGNQKIEMLYKLFQNNLSDFNAHFSSDFNLFSNCLI